MPKFNPQWHWYGNNWIADAVCSSIFFTNLLRCHLVKSWLNFSSSLLKTCCQPVWNTGLKILTLISGLDIYPISVSCWASQCVCHSLENCIYDKACNFQNWFWSGISRILKKCLPDTFRESCQLSLQALLPCILPERSPLPALSTFTNQRNRTTLNSCVKFALWNM